MLTPQFSIPDRPSKLDPFAEKLSGWLLREARKPRKQRKTVKLLYKDLAALGYGGSYERVAAFARSWRADRLRDEQSIGRGVFVPLASLEYFAQVELVLGVLTWPNGTDLDPFWVHEEVMREKT